MAPDPYAVPALLVRVTAAQIGISKQRWMSITEEELAEFGNHLARRRMAAGRLDILPIIHGKHVNGYFQTSRWGAFDRPLERKTPTPTDHLEEITEFPALLARFQQDQRRFYFLSRGDDISGLVTESNINTRLVKVYFFSLISELEDILGRIIHNEIDEALFYRIKDSVLTPAGKKSIIDNYEPAKIANIETKFVDSLYLTDLLKLIKHTSMGHIIKSSLGKGQIYSINVLRNNVSHVRPLMTDTYTINHLYADHTGILRLLATLRTVL